MLSLTRYPFAIAVAFTQMFTGLYISHHHAQRRAHIHHHRQERASERRLRTCVRGKWREMTTQACASDDDDSVSWCVRVHTNLAPSASSFGGPPARVTCAMAPAIFFTRELPPIFRTRAAAAFSCRPRMRERIDTDRHTCMRTHVPRVRRGKMSARALSVKEHDYFVWQKEERREREHVRRHAYMDERHCVDMSITHQCGSPSSCFCTNQSFSLSLSF